jgi:hypothetical protein
MMVLKAQHRPFTAPDRAAPPRHSPLGAGLWRSITSEYGVEDAGGIEMLLQDCTALDRAESLRSQIEADGEISRTKPASAITLD